ncbi:helix-turn-helix transcriptional regulator [Klebsiella pneumoniae]|nr:helix-turn-helix transcriptional regulator [Klebsiella pneumoniae]
MRFFTNERWIDYLIETKLKIVIVCDKYLKPLANYWFKHSKDIFLVIYQQDRLTLACEKLKRDLSISATPSLAESHSELEFAVLSALISGDGCLQLADELNVDIRTIYAAKRRAEKKMGADINTLFRFSHSL